MPKISAGILCYRIKDYLFEVLLVHPGGPFWKNKDLGAWSIPKGEPNENEPLLDAAKREFAEETGITVSGNFIELEPVQQKGHKQVHAFAVAFDADVTNITSNKIFIEWPPRSGKQITIPEVDKAAWFNIIDAGEKINQVQAALIDQLLKKVFNLDNGQLEKIKMLGNIIKHRRLISFNYTSHKNKPEEHTGWRKVEPYMVGKYLKEKGHVSLSGYIVNDETHSSKHPHSQGNYKVDEINLTEFKLLDEVYTSVKIPRENIFATPSMVLFYRTDIIQYE